MDKLYTYFRWDHVIVRGERVDFLWHLPTRYFSLIVWRWRKDAEPYGLYRRTLGILIKPWSDALEAPFFWGLRVGPIYVRTYFRRARGMREWKPEPDADGYVLLPPEIAAAAVAAELEQHFHRTNTGDGATTTSGEAPENG